MNEKRLRGMAWLAALTISLSLLAIAAFLLDFRYAGNDDTAILRSFMGYETGVPAHFNLFIHGLLAWPLHWLGLAFPQVAWFSVLQIALLVFACTLIGKSIIQCFLKHGHSFWLGTLFALLFLVCFGLPNMVHITFTVTAAVLGAAAVLQIFSIRFEHASDGEIVRGMLLALLPVVLAYALRQVTLLPILAFCGLSVAMVSVFHFGFGKHKKRPLKPILTSVLLIVLALGGLMGARQLEIKGNHAEPFLAWQDANAGIMDYYTLNGIPNEELEKVGWSENTRNLAAGWFFLEPQISSEAFQQLDAYQRQQFAAPLQVECQRAWHTIKNLKKSDVITMRSLSLVFFVLIFCAISLLFRRGQRLSLLSALLLACALFGVMVFYLAFEGRLPLRAFLMPFLPFAAMLMAFLPHCLPLRFAQLQSVWQAKAAANSTARAPRAFALLFCVFTLLCCAQTAYYLRGILPSLSKKPELALELGSPTADLDEYALANPDVLFIFDGSLAIDTRLFPDVSAGIPHNVTFWGGWPMRSADSIEQFAKFGIDLLNFPADTFLREDVCLASGVLDPPPTLIMNYIAENISADVDYSIYDEYGNIHFFQFYVQ
ncbi:MAG: hypothetical protein RSE58_08490 [Clostridia bacterium]